MFLRSSVTLNLHYQIMGAISRHNFTTGLRACKCAEQVAVRSSDVGNRELHIAQAALTSLQTRSFYYYFFSPFSRPGSSSPFLVAASSRFCCRSLFRSSFLSASGLGLGGDG